MPSPPEGPSQIMLVRVRFRTWGICSSGSLAKVESLLAHARQMASVGPLFRLRKEYGEDLILLQLSRVVFLKSTRAQEVKDQPVWATARQFPRAARLHIDQRGGRLCLRRLSPAANYLARRRDSSCWQGRSVPRVCRTLNASGIDDLSEHRAGRRNRGFKHGVAHFLLQSVATLFVASHRSNH